MKYRDLVVEVLSNWQKLLPPANPYVPIFHIGYFKQDRFCGTINCAAGYIAQHPEFNKLGFKMDDWSRPVFKNYSAGQRSIIKFFNITDKTYGEIFLSTGYISSDKYGAICDADETAITLNQVIEKIQKEPSECDTKN